MEEWFSRAATWASHHAGRSHTFILAITTILVWGLTGPLFGFSDTWQLIINTGTTVITFLMIFLLQNTLNRDNLSLHIKLDELIASNTRAHNSSMKLEHLTESELREMLAKFECMPDNPEADR